MVAAFEAVPVVACEISDNDQEVEADSVAAVVADTNRCVQYFSFTSHPIFLF